MCYCMCSCIEIYTGISKYNSKKMSLHRPWCKGMQVGHLVPLRLYRLSHFEISEGIQNLVALVCFFFSLFFSFAFFSAVYYCGSDVFTSLSSTCYIFYPKAVMVTEC